MSIQNLFSSNDLHLHCDTMTCNNIGGNCIHNCSNVGAGSQVFKQLSGTASNKVAEFRTLTAGSGVTIVQNTNDISITATGSSAPVQSVFARTGNVVATEGDYNLGQLGDVSIVAPTNVDILKFNGTVWEKAPYNVFNDNINITAPKIIDFADNFSVNANEITHIDLYNDEYGIGISPFSFNIICAAVGQINFIKKDSVTPLMNVHNSGLVTVTGRITGVSTPTGSSDAATKSYVDGFYVSETFAQSWGAALDNFAQDIYLTRANNIVTVTLPALAQPYFANQYIIGQNAMPLKYRPVVDNTFGIRVIENGANVFGSCTIAATGLIYISVGPDSPFSMAGNIGFAGVSCSWITTNSF